MTQKSKEVPFSTPTLGSGGDTGSWRTERPVLDESKCIDCLFCWMYCPEGSISELKSWSTSTTSTARVAESA